MNEEYKCKDCKWLTGKKNIRGIECMNPKNQEKWNKAKTLWMGELRKDTARYKQRNAPACKKFKAKESKPMSRYIDADALITDLNKGLWGKDWDKVLAEAIINEAPSIDIEPKRGEWVKVDDVSISCRCSVCGWEAHLYEDDVYGMPYCPNCGARMKGADDEQ